MVSQLFNFRPCKARSPGLQHFSLDRTQAHSELAHVVGYGELDILFRPSLGTTPGITRWRPTNPARVVGSAEPGFVLGCDAPACLLSRLVRATHEYRARVVGYGEVATPFLRKILWTTAHLEALLVVGLAEPVQ